MSIETNKTEEKKEREHMRYLHYKLANGTIVNTYAEAQASGKPYTEVLENVPTPLGRISPKRKEMLDTYGFVTPVN